MKYNNDIEEEIDIIRDNLYATIKAMTSKERVEYINERARAIMEKHCNNHGTMYSDYPHLASSVALS